ncbi:MAG: bifunctional DNase/RNase [Granulosicoccus sp.]|jgi:bifunctional DNase/RNase
MDQIRLDIIGLSYSQTQSGAYALVLEESEGQRRLPIVIGSAEAQSIAIELENMSPTRPLTHDLMKSMADEFKINLDEVLIYNLVDGVFYSKLICNDGTRTVEIDSRTSDAIALAVRFGCPIFTYEFILSSAGFEKQDDDEDSEGISPIIEEDDEAEEIVQEGGALTALSKSELDEKLQEAIDNENYERASIIRDEINRRS